MHEDNDSFALMYAEAFRVELALRQGNLAEAQRLSIGVELDPRPPSFYLYVPQLTPIKLMMAEGTPEKLVAARASLARLDEQISAIHVRPSGWMY